jgi:hypothetical protein
MLRLTRDAIELIYFIHGGLVQTNATCVMPAFTPIASNPRAIAAVVLGEMNLASLAVIFTTDLGLGDGYWLGYALFAARLFGLSSSWNTARGASAS